MLLTPERSALAAHWRNGDIRGDDRRCELAHREKQGLNLERCQAWSSPAELSECE